MSETSIIDLATLLAPISDDKPAGENLRDDASPGSAYYQIKDLRTTARANERKALTEADAGGFLQPSDWRPITDVAPKIIATRSKDLEVVAWYIEALARTHGFAGMADGFVLAQQLIDQYWDQLYPLPDEDGIASRIAPVIGLNGSGGEGTLIAPIKYLDLTEGATQGPFANWQCQQAFEIERITSEEKKQQRIASGAISMDMVSTAIKETSPLFLRGLKTELDRCIRAYASLTASIDRVCKEDPQPTSNIKQALQSCRETLMFVAGDILKDPEIEEAASEATAASGATGVPKAAAVRSGPVSDRPGAIRALKEIAEFFRKTEPHSPVSYAVDQAVRWCDTPLPKLLEELITDSGARDQFFRMTGIPRE
jgi:type VI secretion system protein ImpA